MNWLKILIALAAITIAGSAAFFSVTGLGVLFSGASLSVMIMAASLEYAKLVTATYLKQKWDEIKGFNKWYLTFSVVILMVITSAGIFGFLSNAFQQQSLKLDQVEREISVWDIKIKSNNDQITSLTTQLTALQSNQGTILEKGKVNNRLLRSVDNRDKQANVLSEKISALQNDNVKFNEEINNIKNKNIDLEKEVGGFRFVAEAFGVELKSVVKFFIFLIVIVFDPLAIALVIAFNSLMITKKKAPSVDPVVENTEESIKENVTIDSKELLSEISRIRLSEEDLKILEARILNPPPPNQNLKDAADKYNEVVKEENKTNEVVQETVTETPAIDLVLDLPVEEVKEEIYEKPEDEKIISENEASRQEIHLDTIQSNQDTVSNDVPFENPIQDQYEDELWGDDELEEVLNSVPEHGTKVEELSTIEASPIEEEQIFSTKEPEMEIIFQNNEPEVPIVDEVPTIEKEVDVEPIIEENASSEENLDDEKKKI